ncbi:hypothetical protein SKAU_G00144030 [Synaphobranchus kaupii]|uniref:Uncharacterized protein n=1 Tax=Synaphobranchus kaupii TaxID=118154 RepID=A0A9Q1FSX5_SYNKA|nr:hypothetical protein SKAU_G00144030 [Synaphobranchus kaupii]
MAAAIVRDGDRGGGRGAGIERQKPLLRQNAVSGFLLHASLTCVCGSAERGPPDSDRSPERATHAYYCLRSQQRARPHVSPGRPAGSAPSGEDNARVSVRQAARHSLWCSVGADACPLSS